MNKNYPFILWSYLISLLIIYSLENWFSLWIVLELNTLTFIPLMMKSLTGVSVENSISYFLVQTISSLILMLSMIPLLFFNYFFSPSLIFFFSLMLKLAVSPLQAWMLSVGLTSSWMILMALLSVQKIIPMLFLEYYVVEMSNILIFFCIMSLIMGGISNMSANSLKYMMIFSSISSVGWILLSINFSSKLWKMFIFIYFSSLFFILWQNTKKMKKNQNLLIWLSWLSISGVPPFYGFFPKLIIIITIMKLDMYFLLITFLIFSILDMFIYLRINYSSFLFYFTHSLWHKNIKNNLLLLWMIVNLVFSTMII